MQYCTSTSSLNEQKNRANAVYVLANKSNCEKSSEKTRFCCFWAINYYIKKIDDAVILRCECAAKSIKRSSELQIHILFVVLGGNLLMVKSERASSSNQLLGDLLNTCLVCAWINRLFLFEKRICASAWHQGKLFHSVLVSLAGKSLKASRWWQH